MTNPQMNTTEKRLAIFVPSMNEGGAERSMLRLAQGIADKNYPVDLVLARPEGPYLDEIPPNVRLINLKSSRVLSSLPKLIAYLLREKPYALLSVLDYANIVALWARKFAKIPQKVVVNEQNTISLTSKHSSQKRQQLIPWFVKNFYPWADLIIGNAKGVADDLSQAIGLNRQKIDIIYNPVVTPELQQKAQASLEHPWFAPGQPPVILAVGRLTIQKDFPTLIQAFAQVRRTQTARLLILGEGSDRTALEDLIKQLGLENDVSLAGFVKNPYAYMTRASVFVLSSRWEGLPTVLIEALYCGIPIVATDCLSGAREILKDGQYGQLVPIGDVNAIAKAIEKVLVDKIPPAPVESWRPFELETVVNQYINILFEN